jgi:Mg-chelatase subunit ChlD
MSLAGINSETQAWAIFVVGILKEKNLPLQEIDEPQFSVKDGVLNIMTTNPAVQKIFLDLADDQTMWDVEFNQKKYGIASYGAEEKRDSPPKASPNILMRIFGEQIIRDCALAHLVDLSSTQAPGRSIGGVWIAHKNAPGYKELWEGRAKIMKWAMLDAEIEGMRDAYFGITPGIAIRELPEPAPDSFEGEQDLVDDVIKITPERVSIDYQALYNLLFPCPEANVTSTVLDGKTQYTIMLKKHELIQRFMPHIWRPAVLPNGKLRLLFWPAAAASGTKKILTSLVLDFSGSMHSSIAEYKLRLCEVVAQLVTTGKEGDIIRIIRFSNQASAWEITLCEEESTNYQQIIKNLQKLINEFTADGDTALYDTVSGELAFLEQEKWQHYAKKVLIIGDGCDSLVNQPVGVEKLAQLNLRFENLAQQPHSAPQVITVAYGKHTAIELFQNWAGKSGGAYVYLDDLDKLKSLLDFEQLRCERKLITVKQGRHEYRFSAYAGMLTASPDLDCDKSFSIGEDTFMIPSHSPIKRLTALFDAKMQLSGAASSGAAAVDMGSTSTNRRSAPSCRRRCMSDSDSDW